MLASWVKDTTSTAGVGTITLLGAESAAFAAISDFSSDQQSIPYVIFNGDNKEAGVGTYTTSGTTLSRDVIYETLVGGVYTNIGATPITLAGDSTIIVTNHINARSNPPISTPNMGPISKVYNGELWGQQSIAGALNLAGSGANTVYMGELKTRGPIIIDTLGFDLRIASTVGAGLITIGIYKETLAANVFIKLYETAAIDVTGSTGVKAVALTAGQVNLPPGDYVMAVGNDGTSNGSIESDVSDRLSLLPPISESDVTTKGFRKIGVYSAGLPNTLTLDNAIDDTTTRPHIWINQV